MLLILCFILSDQAKACLSGIGLENYDFKTGELWAFCSYKKRDEGEQISLARGFDAVELEASIKLGDIDVQFVSYASASTICTSLSWRNSNPAEKKQQWQQQQ